MGRTFNGIENLISTCDKLLGSVPDTTNDCFGTQIKFSWIHKTFRTLPKKVTEEVEDRHTRAYLFYLVGTQIFSNTSGSRGNAFILNLFKNFEKYAWGPACLANFYRMLGKASKGSKTITGPLSLLQVIVCMQVVSHPSVIIKIVIMFSPHVKCFQSHTDLGIFSNDNWSSDQKGLGRY